MIAATSLRRLSYPTPDQWTPLHAPNPYTDSNNPGMHPSVIDMGIPWNGYRWWMANTPYEGDFGNAMENPCIWGSNDRVTWHVPNGLVNPIDPWPGEGTDNHNWYNSDTELVWDPVERQMVCFWRETLVGSGVTKWWAAISTSGHSWEHLPEPVLSIPPSADVSAAVDRDPTTGEWRMFTFRDGCAVRTAPTPLGPWSNPVAPTFDAEVDPYHGSMIWYRGVWFLIFTGGVPAASQDGYEWAVGAPIEHTPGQVMYGYRHSIRPAPEAGMIDVWASSTSRYYHVPATNWTDLL